MSLLASDFERAGSKINRLNCGTLASLTTSFNGGHSSFFWIESVHGLI